MINWKTYLVLLYCCGGAFCAASNGTREDFADGTEKHSSEEVSIPKNMNVADYYYSIFGKHLDYDYKEPILTFEEPTMNDLSDEIESEVDKDSNTDIWDNHSRTKRFILVPANFYNATRRWAQQRRRLRMERRRLRNQRRERWQQNRVNYLNARSESLRKQASRLSQRQQITTRNVPVAKTASTSDNNNSSGGDALTLSNSNPIASESNQIPVKQVPIPTKT